MATVPDKFFELAMVDPPYGINITKQSGFGTFKSNKTWDNNIPDDLYFNKLFRISKNQIIWGGNYFINFLFNTPCLISWDKMNGTNDFADFEIAWSSFNSPCKMYRMHHFSKGNNKKIHPCQKPINLYRWLLQNYAKPGDRIFDSHVGSASSLIACHLEGFEYIGCEKDEDYYREAKQRLDVYTAQQDLFRNTG